MNMLTKLLLIMQDHPFRALRRSAWQSVQPRHRMLERAVRKNGVSVLLDPGIQPTADHLSLDLIGQGLRMHFAEALREPIPARLHYLVQRLETAGAF